jgi:hypothetical protein
MGFIRGDHPRPPIFVDFEDAVAWIMQQLSDATAEI